MVPLDLERGVDDVPPLQALHRQDRRRGRQVVVEAWAEEKKSILVLVRFGGREKVGMDRTLELFRGRYTVYVYSRGMIEGEKDFFVCLQHSVFLMSGLVVHFFTLKITAAE